jgi:hypothetical protein
VAVSIKVRIASVCAKKTITQTFILHQNKKRLRVGDSSSFDRFSEDNFGKVTSTAHFLLSTRLLFCLRFPRFFDHGDGGRSSQPPSQIVMNTAQGICPSRLSLCSVDSAKCLDTPLQIASQTIEVPGFAIYIIQLDIQLLNLIPPNHIDMERFIYY